MQATSSVPLYNRVTQSLENEQVFGQAAMDFLYGTSIGRLLTTHLLAPPLASRLYGWLSKQPGSRQRIAPFVAQYGIDVNELAQPLEAYPDFNAFFIRELKATARPIPTDPTLLISPADARLLAYPLNDETILPVKGKSFRLAELTQNSNLSHTFANGWCLVFRLAPVDYHRFIYIADGQHGEHYRIPGRLHSVNPLALWQALPIFQENEREYCLLKTHQWGPILEIEVGALVVGKIIQHLRQGGHFTRGQEKGYFELGGSTIIMVFQAHQIELDADILHYSQQGIETLVKCGSAIGKRPVS